MDLNRLIKLLTELRADLGGDRIVKANIRRAKTKFEQPPITGVGFRRLDDYPDGCIVLACDLFEEE